MLTLRTIESDETDTTIDTALLGDDVVILGSWGISCEEGPSRKIVRTDKTRHWRGPDACTFQVRNACNVSEYQEWGDPNLV